MKYLRDKNIGCTGTVKRNMFGDCPLHTKIEFKKQPKGSYQEFQEESTGVDTVMWNDNGTVTIV